MISGDGVDTILVPLGTTGVVGFQPVLKPGECFQYVSYTNATSPSAHMWGSFTARHLNGDEFEAIVAPFRFEGVNVPEEDDVEIVTEIEQLEQLGQVETEAEDQSIIDATVESNDKKN